MMGNNAMFNLGFTDENWQKKAVLHFLLKTTTKTKQNKTTNNDLFCLLTVVSPVSFVPRFSEKRQTIIDSFIDT